MTSTPSSWERIVAALMTLLIPGAGPPPTRIASRFCWVTSLILADRSMQSCHGSPSATDVLVPRSATDLHGFTRNWSGLLARDVKRVVVARIALDAERVPPNAAVNNFEQFV